jgi:hypothetical protein
MSKITLLALVVGVAGIQAGCARQKEIATAIDAGAGIANLTPASSTSTTAATATAPSLPYGLALADRLRNEAAGRPTETPKAEDVLAAIVNSGVPLQDEAQHLASPIGARFCVGAKSPQNLAMSACEYADVAAATAGRDASAKAFGAIEHRDIVVNKKTTLTILQSPFDPQSQAAHDKAVAAFKKMM